MVINVFSDAVIVDGVDILVDVDTIVVTTAAIDLESVSTVLYNVDVLGDVRTDVTIVVVTDTGADVLADVMAALELPALLLEESKLFC